MTNLVAKNPSTGLYFNGTNFIETEASKALVLRPGTTAADFRHSWGTEVEIEQRPTHTPLMRVEPTASLPQCGCLARPEEYKAAYQHVIEMRSHRPVLFVEGTVDKSITGKRRVYLEMTGPRRCAYIRIKGTSFAIYKRGESFYV